MGDFNRTPPLFSVADHGHLLMLIFATDLSKTSKALRHNLSKSIITLLQ